jgi:hypothetical protein
MDCIPAGVRNRGVGPAEQEALASEIRRAARRYDITIVSAPLFLARGVLAGGDVLICATVARTRLSVLARSASGLRDYGARVVAVALSDRKRTGIHLPLSRRRSHASLAKGATDAA